MIYSSTDIILCFSGVGRSFFTASSAKMLKVTFFGFKPIEIPNSSFTADIDIPEGCSAKTFVDTIVTLKNTKQYRYILAPLNDKIRDELEAKSVAFITVVPLLHQWDEWSKRWLKAGATAEQLNARLADWNKYYKELEGWDYDDFAKPIIHLKDDEWLGNILCQSNEPKAKE